ncbi:MarR family transcriptional regulator [Desulforamulus aquiferis]|uniref:MarR family transcriptional regulator n=1 Tax=Desulforamulus aquiferis TaxID=1397668 RepID=A0AAW7ZBD0_9FIRM|nr:MarR family transcriptional regulator [Desulforamulus aquiferis]MDO7786652.1 MarR family transcriptional regulator [Desulforamulus aquiferis]RYD05887.1 hypothetical protein N752_08305 [Desulforamulus aquiferis]
MVDKKKIVIEIDNLYEKITIENNCQVKELLHHTITPSQFVLLKLISTNENCKAADIAHILGISPAATTTILDRLYKNDWIERVRSEKDRRIVWLKLTQKGFKVLDEIDTKRLELLFDRFKNLSEEELNMIKGAYQMVLRSLKNN